MVKEDIDNQLLMQREREMQKGQSGYCIVLAADQMRCLLVCVFSFVSSLSVFSVWIVEVIAGGALQGVTVHAESLASCFCLSGS